MRFVRCLRSTSPILRRASIEVLRKEKKIKCQTAKLPSYYSRDVEDYEASSLDGMEEVQIQAAIQESLNDQ